MFNMQCAEEIKCKLISLAESVRGQIMFDLMFKIEPSFFFKLKFKNDEIEKQKLCSSIYKYTTE